MVERGDFLPIRNLSDGSIAVATYTRTPTSVPLETPKCGLPGVVIVVAPHTNWTPCRVLHFTTFR